MIIIIILIVIILVFLFFKRNDYFTNVDMKFKTPSSFTKLKSSPSQIMSNKTTTTKTNLIEQYGDNLNSLANIIKVVDKVNIIQTPSFFNCGERWPGCLPRPLFQGTCGSCWGFAAVTCLSSRFFIETCGNGGCNNYPQVNNGSIDDVFYNLNVSYSFKKIYLKSMVDMIDANKNENISKKEWIDMSTKLQKQVWKLDNDYSKRHEFAQILVYMLDFQSLGSIDLSNANEVKKRAEKTFNVWFNVAGSNKQINIPKLQEFWRKQPLNLSAEKLIACCVDCLKLDFKTGPKKAKKVNNPICAGGSLDDAWILLRDTGTPTTLCIGYSLDNYTEGDQLLSCKQIVGPFYSFCSGYSLDKMDSSTLQKEIDKIEESDIYPPAIPNGSKTPWIDPQFFRFRAKNAYTIKNDMAEIQREIMQRGPVNSGFYVYQDFEALFGGKGQGGQLSGGSNPLGSTSECLIYMKDPSTKETPSGGHAITIVGWGNYKYKYKNKEYNIPYWTCLNSWGVEWGHSGFPDYNNRNGKPINLKGGGYFWIVRGINNCGIEENVTCGQPNIENMSYPNVIERYGWGADPPSLNNESVKFLPKLNTSAFNTKDFKLEISDPLEGGGTYVDFIDGKYDIKSMDPPSPYLMFWPQNRPTFCIGSTLNNLDKTTDIIDVTSRTLDFIKIIQKNTPNPLLLIGDESNQEQIQLLKTMNLKIKVLRAVNYNTPNIHKKDSNIKVFPYGNLYISFLKKNGFVQCSTLI